MSGRMTMTTPTITHLDNRQNDSRNDSLIRSKLTANSSNERRSHCSARRWVKRTWSGDIEFDQAPPSRFAYSSSIASSYSRSASISACVFSRVVPAPVFTPAPVALELESPVCDCSDRDESMFGSEPDVAVCSCEDDGVVEVRKGIVTAELAGREVDLRVDCLLTDSYYDERGEVGDAVLAVAEHDETWTRRHIRHLLGNVILRTLHTLA